MSFGRGNGDTTGTGAAATAQVNPRTGAVDAIYVTDPGSGYTATPVVTISSPGITPTSVASASAVVSQGVLASVAVDEGGYGYTQPHATVSGGNPTTAALLQASGGLDVIQITSGGSGYVNQPLVEFSQPQLDGGVAPTAVATMDSHGVVTDVEVVTPGSGYTSAPTVTITDAGQVNEAGAAVVVATLKVTQVDVIPDLSNPPVTGGCRLRLGSRRDHHRRGRQRHGCHRNGDDRLQGCRHRCHHRRRQPRLGLHHAWPEEVRRHPSRADAGRREQPRRVHPGRRS